MSEINTCRECRNEILCYSTPECSFTTECDWWEKKEQPRTRFDEFKENLTLEQLASILSKDEENCKPCPVYEYCRKTTGLWCHEIVLLWCNELVEDGE